MPTAIMPADTDPGTQVSFYTCPECHGVLRTSSDALQCEGCSESFAIRDGIPEFISEELSRSQDPELKRMTAIDRMAPIYETKLWYPIVLSVYGGWGRISLPQLISQVTHNISSVRDRVLDIACGPGTYGRRAARDVREVWGIDVSRGMLRQGLTYTAKDGVRNMHFARARVEKLPFRSGCFEGVLCCGSLHLFTDTLAALREMARVTQPSGVLSVFTFTPGDAGILKHRRIREWMRSKHGLHVFELPEVERLLELAGFEGFDPKVFGSILTFKAHRKVV